MCRLVYPAEEWDYEYLSPVRPHPRVAWAVPVDAAELGASLTAYQKWMEQVQSLRLCHRFGLGPFSRLPQEILDHIITIAHSMDKGPAYDDWMRDSVCFQGFCSTAYHIPKEDPTTQQLWENLRDDGCWDINSIDEQELTKEEKAKMVHDVIDNGDVFSEWMWNLHNDAENSWLNRLCLCQSAVVQGQDATNFVQLNEVLKSCFGVEVIISHEAPSRNLKNFHPGWSGMFQRSFQTVCFLGLLESSAASPTACKSTGRTALHPNPAFMDKDNHLAFHQALDPAKLNITDEQRSRFSNAMRVLGLRPRYQLTDLESRLTAENTDAEFWAICDVQIPGCPAPTNESKEIKNKRLEAYLAAMQEEVAKQSWPQLMQLAASDVVIPTPD